MLEVFSVDFAFELLLIGNVGNVISVCSGGGSKRQLRGLNCAHSALQKFC